MDRKSKSQLHNPVGTLNRPNKGFPDDAVLALVPYYGPDGEIKETAVVLREKDDAEESHIA